MNRVRVGIEGEEERGSGGQMLNSVPAGGSELQGLAQGPSAPEGTCAKTGAHAVRLVLPRAWRVGRVCRTPRAPGPREGGRTPAAPLPARKGVV